MALRIKKKITPIASGSMIETIVDGVVVLIPVEPEPEDEKKVAARLARMYFNSNTQAAIVSYQQQADNRKERNRLYLYEIYPAFEKLAENLINIHKFTGLHDSYDDLKNDCVNFLFETIHKFDATRGTNAFSYFNVVAKNWLIIKTKQKTLRVKRTVSLDDPDSLSSNEYKIVEDQHVVNPSDVNYNGESASSDIMNVLQDIRYKAKTENELACINSIITIFENVNNIDLLNKSAILLYMRELSGLSPKQLTTTMQMVKKHYRKLRNQDLTYF